jgi:structural maintenance of chromosome 3 (chondroitin sulfate proteoglycan 6)
VADAAFCAAMHIQSITIAGFKSYRDATLTGPFSPRHNVVVGRNGSGKSNFFDAVRFLLADTFAHLRGEERVALLHEGAGASVLSAYVEMVFDNTDGRLPFERATVALRRMVGLQKDEYVLDRKSVSRTEVFNLLESAGFSRSNPYYIVQQGKVAALCAMSDRNRLELLKEVAGTRVYDERRDESLRIMDETDAKREKISDVILYLEARLAELDSEKDELKNFQALDRDRRALEYTIYVKDLDGAKEALDVLSAARAERSAAGSDASARLLAARAAIVAGDNDLNTARAQLRTTVGDRDELDKARRNAVAAVAKLEVDVSEAERAAQSAGETVRSASAELVSIDATIAERQAELSPLQAQFTAAQEMERASRSRAALLEASVLALRVKAERSNQFQSVEDRNRFLAGEIEEARKATAAARKQRSKGEADVARLEAACAANMSKVEARKAEINELEASMACLDAELASLRSQRDAVHAQRHEKWRLDAEYSGKANALSGNHKRLEAAKRASFGVGSYHAIKTVMDAAAGDPQNLGAARVYGPLVDLIRVDEKFTTAADVTAGNSLTHVVVDTDATAARLVSILQEKRAGRVTFVPLNRLGAPARPPPEATVDALPLVSKITCDERFKAALNQVFGRTLVTRTVDVAAQMSASHGVDCVTLDGDQVNKQGAMTGGFIDLSRSKIDAVRELRRGEDELARIQPQAALARAAAAEIDAKLSQLLGEIQQRDATRRSSQFRAQRLRDEIDHLTRYARLDGENVPKAKDRIVALDDAIAASDERRSELEAETVMPLTAGLDDEEAKKLHALHADLDRTRRSVADALGERTRLQSAVAALNSELNGHLELRRSELRQIVESGASGGDEGGGEAAHRTHPAHVLDALRGQLASAKTELATSEAALALLGEACTELEAVATGLAGKLDRSKEEVESLNELLECDKTHAESLFSQRVMYAQKKADAERKIRELGSLPADFDKYRTSSVVSLMRRLERTNEALNKYVHVNKKALDQFVNFTEQRELLRRRREELHSGAEAIRQLIESLDQRKDADILRTFKGVSKYFAEVFAELVPGGRAGLVMQKSSAGGDAGAKSAGRVSYTGVAMKVRFSATGEAFLLRQLSGGQKSVVALALIFAIQRLDPAPFYLFDEIDANLDATHRQAVANVIRKQAGGKAQFITTTFRPELVNAGDRWFGVTHQSKVSSVQEVTREVARTFVNKDEGRNP